MSLSRFTPVLQVWGAGNVPAAAAAAAAPLVLLTPVPSPTPGQKGGVTSFLQELIPAGTARGAVYQELPHGKGICSPVPLQPENFTLGQSQLGAGKGIL